MLARLEAAVEAPVTTVCAPAGYGKTLLLADWFTTAATPAKAWLSLDSDDNSPARFWNAILHALREHGILPRGSPLRTANADPAEIVQFLAELSDGLEALPSPFCLVLDDFHEIVEHETLHGIGALIRHQPGPLRLVLSSRLDPPLPLARLRLQERLRALRASDLLFSARDAAALLESSGVRLNEHQLHRLLEQTDGWAAGLRLAAQSLRRTTDRNAFLDDFACDDRAVADYLVGEVLADLPEETKDILAAVSVCDEVAPSLAAELTNREEAGVVLDGLERENSLVMGIGHERRWYRLHPLLRSYLRGDLRRRRPDRAAELNHAAATWFASEDMPRAALDHAVRADQSETIRMILRDHAVGLLLDGNHDIVEQALRAAGPAAVAADRRLTLITALTRLEQGELELAGTHLSRADVLLEPVDPVVADPLRDLIGSTYALMRAECGKSAWQTWPDFSEGHYRPGLETWARLVDGWTALCRGDRAAARRQLDVVQRMARDLGLDYLLLHVLLARGTAAGLESDLNGLVEAATEAVALAAAKGWPVSPCLGLAHSMLGFAHLLRLEPTAALTEAGAAKATIADGRAPRLSYLAAVVEGGARFDVGERDAPVALIGRARRLLSDRSLLPELTAAGALVEYRCALLLGYDAAAGDVLRWAHRRIGDSGEVALMTAWGHFAHGSVEQAVHALDEGRPPLLAETAVEGHLLRSAMAISSIQRTRARDELEAAVQCADPAGLVRPFRWADPHVLQLLMDQVGSYGAADAFAADICRSVTTSNAEYDGLLTEREHAVLTHLDTQRSLDEVATDMAVSVNTVKTHIRAIYAKLGVNNRRAAVLCARERGIA